MSKIIIGIHGLGNKPPKELLEKWWMEAISEGLRKINRYRFKPKFELVYWADILNDKPLNNLITDPKNPYYLDEPYVASIDQKENEEKPSSTRMKFLEFLEDQMDKIFLNNDLSSNFEFVSDIIFKKYFMELDVYYSKQPEVNDPEFKSVRDIIRNRLANVLRKHKGKDILLIAHSMGSIIAFDVCNLIVPEIKIHTLATIGSPLGMPIIVSKIAEELREFYPDIHKIRTPKNIKKSWFNFSDIEDNVALNYNLADDYEENEFQVKVKDTVIVNDYFGSKEPNPHKSYGYLRAPEFSNMLADFIYADCSSFKLWYFEILSKIKEKFDNFSFIQKGE